MRSYCNGKQIWAQALSRTFFRTGNRNRIENVESHYVKQSKKYSKNSYENALVDKTVDTVKNFDNSKGNPQTGGVFNRTKNDKLFTKYTRI